MDQAKFELKSKIISLRYMSYYNDKVEIMTCLHFPESLGRITVISATWWEPENPEVDTYEQEKLLSASKCKTELKRHIQNNKEVKNKYG